MNEFEFTFDITPWEEYLAEVEDTASAMTLLTLMEGESEETFEDALAELEEKGAKLDVSGLPKPSGTGEAALRLRQEVQMVAKGLHPKALEAGDPLRLYLEEVAMTPAFGDVQLLAEDAAAGNEKAMEKLTNLYLSRVIEIACQHVGNGVLLLDLIQEGSLGLWQAIGNFAMGDFAAHADRQIRFAMAKAITIQARESGVGQKMRTALEDYRSVDERLLGELGRNPTLGEIAESLHITEEAAVAIGQMLQNARLLQSAHHTPEPEEEAEAEEQAVEDTAYFQSRQRINDMLSGLDELGQKVIALRFGLEGGLPLSPEEVGRKLGLTPDEVVTKEAAALAAMRKH